jgi:hypothetical protein
MTTLFLNVKHSYMFRLPKVVTRFNMKGQSDLLSQLVVWDLKLSKVVLYNIETRREYTASVKIVNQVDECSCVSNIMKHKW